MWPVKLEAINGHFCASILGDSGLRVEGATREEALISLQAEMDNRMRRGEIVMMAPIKSRRGSISAMAGTVSGDAAEIAKEIVANRNSFDIDDAYDNADYGETPEDFIRALYEIRDQQKEWDLNVMDRT